MPASVRRGVGWWRAP